MLTFFFGSLCIDSSDNKNRAVIDIKYNDQFRHCICNFTCNYFKYYRALCL